MVELPHGTATWSPGCPDWLCGNTARIYGSPIESLEEHGKPSPDLENPFRLVRGKLTVSKGPCAGVANLSLGVRDGGFVGLGGALDSVVCSGPDLEGARFEVQHRPTSTLQIQTTTIRIAKIGNIAPWKRRDSDPQTIPTYDLVAEKNPLLPDEHHLCDAAVWDSTVTNFAFGREKTHHALLVGGEAYSDAGTVVKSDVNGDRWFNIGCAGTAVAKLRLLGFDPMRDPDAKDERQATLKMITSKYCGSRSWTRDGTILLFVQQNASSSGPQLPPRPDGGGVSIGPIETRWGPDGALCISHSRLWSVGSECAKENEAAFVEMIRNECQIPACDETKPCDSPGATGDGFWRTCTVNHIRHGGL